MILIGDCLDILPTLPANSFDAIITDPPYHLTTGKQGGTGAASLNENSPAGRSRIGTGFMGKKWDGGDIAFRPETWSEVLRVAKPGAHLLAFGGTRTFHRMMVAIEDAGFELRDTIMWVYSTGFPKSHNLDRERGNAFCGCEEDSISVRRMSEFDDEIRISDEESSAAGMQSTMQRRAARTGLGETRSQRTDGQKNLYENDGAEESSMERRNNAAPPQRELCAGPICEGSGLGETDGAERRLHHGASVGYGGMVRPSVDADGSSASRESHTNGQRPDEPGIVAGQQEPQTSGAWPLCGGCGKPRIPRGLGTALKPAWEPIVVARKPLVGTVTENVAAHGTGAMNIDASRIGMSDEDRAVVDKRSGVGFGIGHTVGANHGRAEGMFTSAAGGRWPANLIHDGSDEVVALFPNVGDSHPPANADGVRTNHVFGADLAPRKFHAGFADTGSAARFFYCAKADRQDRDEGCDAFDKKPLNWSSGDQNPGSFQAEGTDKSARNNHPTVKPTALMRYLCRLVTPPGGTILDPFAGSGSTGKAAMLEGFEATLIEESPEYAAIAQARVDYVDSSKLVLR